MESYTKDNRLLSNERIRYLKILLLEPLTPLLRKEIRQVITLHSEAPEYLDVDQDIDVLYDRITEHWTKIYSTPISRASTLQQTSLFQQFLTAILLEEYAQEPYTINQWVLSQAAIIEQYHARAEDGGDDDSIYQVHIVTPLEELMLNKVHVENKILSAATTQGPSGSYIQRLIDLSDWSGLAMTLTNDRDLAVGLFEQKPLYPHLFDGNPRERVLRGIDKIQGKYLAKWHPSTSMSHTYARETSTDRSSKDTSLRSSVTPLIQTRPNANPHAKGSTSAENSFTSSIYHALASGFRGSSSSLKSRNGTKYV